MGSELNVGFLKYHQDTNQKPEQANNKGWKSIVKK